MTLTVVLTGPYRTTGDLKDANKGGPDRSDLYWSFAELVAHASRGTWIRPGDIIGSGTFGTGCILELSQRHGSEKFPWLVPGDVVALEIDHHGVLTNTVGPAPLVPDWRLPSRNDRGDS